MSYKRSKYFTTSNKRKIKYLFADNKSQIVVVFFHGFMSDMNGKKPISIQRFCKNQKISYLRFEYSGHGKSSGKFIEGNISKWTDDSKQLIKAKISSISDSSVNLIINDKYDGSISMNELTWLKKPPHPSKIVNISDIIDVKVLEIDNEKRKIICSLKQMSENPWLNLNKKFKINDSFETEIVNIVDFGIFVKVHDQIDGMVHVSDLSWEEKECTKILEGYKKGEKVKVKILDINVDKERISLGIKQLSDDPLQDFLNSNPIKSKVTGKIKEVNEKGLVIELKDNIIGNIKKTNLSKTKSEQKTERFAIGEMVDSMITSVDYKSRSINLSIKEIEVIDEKEALSKYGSSDSGASLGDILGSILKKKD